MKNVALIMAAGTSSRCGFDKLLVELNQQTVLEQCLNTFQGCDLIDEIWVVGKSEVDLELKENLDEVTNDALNRKNNHFRGRPRKICGFIKGGESRFESVKKGILHCKHFYDEEIRLIVHNAANPFLLLEDLNKGLIEAEHKENLIFGFFSQNSIKQVSDGDLVSKFLDREQIFETQTPQISTLENFSEALEVFRVRTQNSKPTTEFELKNKEPKDEAELLTLLEKPIHIYECDPSNTKITFATDFNPTETKALRVGLGEDSHRFANNFDPKKPFRLGGIDMSEEHLSSDGNSDGDVILHALCNALLSACGKKTFDLIAAPICAAGETNSTAYLKATLKYLEKSGHSLNLKQVLISLEGAQPKIAPQHDEIISNLAKLLNIKPSNIGLTYTTGEGLSEYGQGLGIRSYVLITLEI